MALNIFEQYGIKEVANVQFLALEDDANLGVNKGDCVLYLDTLKVSTIEQTAEQTDARGGWGNAKLITWDYNKEVSVTLEDALMSMESLAFMYGGAIKDASASNTEVVIHRSAEGNIADVGSGSTSLGFKSLYDGASRATIDSTNSSLGKLNNAKISYINFTKGTRGQLDMGTTSASDEQELDDLNAKVAAASTAFADGDKVRVFWEEVRSSTSDNSAVEVTISAGTFPGTYRVVGDTFIRSKGTGADSACQFVINKAKVSSEVTLTLEAEGDPSTFSMTLTVLRDENQNMFSLIKY